MDGCALKMNLRVYNRTCARRLSLRHDWLWTVAELEGVQFWIARDRAGRACKICMQPACPQKAKNGPPCDSGPSYATDFGPNPSQCVQKFTKILNSACNALSSEYLWNVIPVDWIQVKFKTVVPESTSDISAVIFNHCANEGSVGMPQEFLGGSFISCVSPQEQSSVNCQLSKNWFCALTILGPCEYAVRWNKVWK